MLILEPRASDDETPESEASIGTADSSENITMETEGATSDPSGVCVLGVNLHGANGRQQQNLL